MAVLISLNINGSIGAAFLGTLNSMTGYATLAGTAGSHRWEWEARSVNGKGLDLRLRLAEGFETLDPDIRAAATQRFKRGNITLTLKQRTVDGATGNALDPEALAAALSRLAAVEAAAGAQGLALGETSAAQILAVPGVVASAASEAPPLEAVRGEIAGLLDGLRDMRAAEGAKLGAILTDQLTAVAAHVGAARTTAEARAARAGDLLKARVAALLEANEQGDPARLAQELALLAVKADVTEELDRLTAHVQAAEALLAAGGPVGRKLDFLMQEFMREANTLCSKSGAADLTQIGLDLKVLIDQMREQVQNLE